MSAVSTKKKPDRKLLYWLIPLLLLLMVVTNQPKSEYEKTEISRILILLKEGDVKMGDDKVIVLDKEQLIQVTTKDDEKFEASFTREQLRDLTVALEEAGAEYEVEVNSPSLLVTFIATMLPFLLILGLIIFFMSRVSSGAAGGLKEFTKSKAKLVSKDTPKTTFADVAGAEEAIEELVEIKEFLQDPKKFQALGAKIPKGVLLYGPPGTGKTLLARAVAGEAGVPFYSMSGSDFVEMFVGVGAKRVRDLFTQAKENSPAIIFIDEIDAVGRHRGAGTGGGHDEREQTLNQMLVEMDGFDARGGVIMIAATNRPDILDPALLRPGRFDRQIAVGRPDTAGRKQILEVHAKGKPFAKEVDLLTVAKRTPGFTGADLANVVNEGALLAARTGAKEITLVHLEEAIDRVMAGPQRKTMLMSEHEKLVTAYHEAGHALVAHSLPNTDPVHKITILPRGRALGYTMVLPESDKNSQTRAELLDQMAYMMGGRAAEDLVFHDPTTGASNDIEKATGVARAMVTQYGMSEKVGAIQLGKPNDEVFLGRDMGHVREYSEEIAALVDSEVRTLLENAHHEAWEILKEYRDVLDQIVLELLEKETLDKKEVAEIFKTVSKRPQREYLTGNGKRPLLDRKPVSVPEAAKKEVPLEVAQAAEENAGGEQ